MGKASVRQAGPELRPSHGGLRTAAAHVCPKRAACPSTHPETSLYNQSTIAAVLRDAAPLTGRSPEEEHESGDFTRPLPSGEDRGEGD